MKARDESLVEARRRPLIVSTQPRTSAYASDLVIQSTAALGRREAAFVARQRLLVPTHPGVVGALPSSTCVTMTEGVARSRIRAPARRRARARLPPFESWHESTLVEPVVDVPSTVHVHEALPSADRRRAAERVAVPVHRVVARAARGPSPEQVRARHWRRLSSGHPRAPPVDAAVPVPLEAPVTPAARRGPAARGGSPDARRGRRAPRLREAKARSVSPTLWQHSSG